MTTTDLTSDNEINAFFHCSSCLPFRPDNQSPREWSRIEAGWTKLGLQIWCRRCEKNICNIDFQGQQHPAVLSTEMTIDQSIAAIIQLLDQADKRTASHHLCLQEAMKNIGVVSQNPSLSYEQQDEITALAERLKAAVDES